MEKKAASLERSLPILKKQILLYAASPMEQRGGADYIAAALDSITIGGAFSENIHRQRDQTLDNIGNHPVQVGTGTLTGLVLGAVAFRGLKTREKLYSGSRGDDFLNFTTDTIPFIALAAVANTASIVIPGVIEVQELANKVNEALKDEALKVDIKNQPNLPESPSSCPNISTRNTKDCKTR